GMVGEGTTGLWSVQDSESEEGTAAPCVRHLGEGPLARADDPETRGEPEALLRPDDHEVHPPGIELERDAGQGADRIDVEEGRVACGVDGPDDGGAVGGLAGRGTVVDHG